MLRQSADVSAYLDALVDPRAYRPPRAPRREQELLELVETVNRANVGVIKRREGSRFALEPNETLGSLANGRFRILIATSRPSLLSRAR